MRLVAQRSSEDELHVLSFRPISQWTLCGVVVGTDWLVRPENPKNFRNGLHTCGPCQRAFWKMVREDAQLVPMPEDEPGFLRVAWDRLRATLGAGDELSGPDESK